MRTAPLLAEYCSPRVGMKAVWTGAYGKACRSGYSSQERRSLAVWRTEMPCTAVIAACIASSVYYAYCPCGALQVSSGDINGKRSRAYVRLCSSPAVSATGIFRPAIHSHDSGCPTRPRGITWHRITTINRSSRKCPALGAGRQAC